MHVEFSEEVTTIINEVVSVTQEVAEEEEAIEMIEGVVEVGRIEERQPTIGAVVEVVEVRPT